MKIQVSLNQKSIKDAIKQLKNTKKQLKGEMLNEFYKKCYDYFVSQANFYLISSGLGDLVIAEIQSSWEYIKLGNLLIEGQPKVYKGIQIRNTAEKAVYVEFGVGIVGEGNKHPNAEQTDYQYNVPSDSKFPIDDAWRFKAYEDELDIPQKAIISHDYTSDGRMRILTRGTEGVWYAHKALMDLRTQYRRIWDEIKIKYWGN